MLANSLILGLITYTSAVVYNLIARKSLETVFYLGLKFLVYTTLMTLFIQLSIYLVKDYQNKDNLKNENQAEEEMDDLTAEAEENEETSEFEKQEFEESAVDNEFESEGFSALNTEEFDYQQNNN